MSSWSVTPLWTAHEANVCLRSCQRSGSSCARFTAFWKAAVLQSSTGAPSYWNTRLPVGCNFRQRLSTATAAEESGNPKLRAPFICECGTHAACPEIDAVPRELKHRAHAKAGKHCKLSRQLQVRR